MLQLKLKILTAALSLVALCPCGRLSCQENSGMPGAKSSRDRIEAKAKRAQVADRTAVADLAAEVLHGPHLFRLDGVAEDMVKARLVEAEISHLSGAFRGVEEKHLAKLFNSMVEKFGAPDYAKTCTSQIRALRVAYLTVNPVFMGRGMIHGRMRVGDKTNSTMSPLQATHVLLTLLDQKMSNPGWQLSCQDWAKARHEKEVRLWQAVQDARSSGRTVGANLNPQGQLSEVNNSKRDEMLAVIRRAFASMTVTDEIGLLADAFNTLGLQW